ncbi:hypothetical protein [Streptoalloteichus hindustanus]|uniref:Uncharacterized protein n=1 Tax=Streptoalloteichus hindustanus TaxID=2017 RepID=A0A1M5AT25_STRHI|nr:hypothetical protein [Streptoalloteichus hindustanus]SHF33389.1 hypothetical protein SAMN05444320_103252 [Streptoalloteichus hindustanus]
MIFGVLVLVLAAFGLLVAALTSGQSAWAWGSVAASAVAGALLLVEWVLRRRRVAARRAARSAAPRNTASGSERPAADGEVAAGDPEPGGAPGSGPTGPLADPSVDALSTAAAGPTGQNPIERNPLERNRAEQGAAKLGPAESGPAESGPKGFAPKGFDPKGFDTAERAAAGTSGDGIAAGPPAGGESAVIRETRDPQPDPEPAEEDTDAADVLAVAELADQVLVVDERPRYHLADCGWLADRPTIPLPVREARELGFTPCALCAPDAVLVGRRRAATASLGGSS